MTEKARSPKKIWCRLILALVLIVGAAVLIPLAYVAWEFGGGWDGMRPEVDPMSSPVVTAREEALAALPAQQDELDALITPITGEPRARGTADGCDRGQNNWKVHDGYTLSCATAAVTVYSWPSDAAAFHQLTAALAEHGYQPETEHSALESPHHTGAANGRYSSGNTELHLEIHPPGRSLPSLYHLRSDAHSVEDMYDVNTVFLRPEETILIVTLSRIYFED
ncbi:MAG: hypothetical protein Q4D89_11670 [Arachnia propionica]|uniref:hypothetical protein n=1 Tax=Arachnia propionica TaxID=1750 RepID=UPI0026FA872B|nr:hypothetical protein [Arachnia propionica]